MCGISGWQFETAPFDDPIAYSEAMLGSLDHRGPDARGHFFNADKSVFLGHNRLSIIDLSERGNQPMENLAGDVMVLNGEIYNYRTLRSELQDLGHSFISDSDSEVAIKAFEQWGVQFTDKLIGMYSIAIWSTREQSLHLFRDPLGIKPLYYWVQPDQRGLVFASELRAFISLPNFAKTIEQNSLRQYLEFGYCFDQHATIFKNVYKVPPGHRLQVKAGKIVVQERFYQPATNTDRRLDTQELEELLYQTLDEVVQEHFVADVPVGLLLSGGLDSSLVGAMAAKHQTVHTFSMGFAGGQVDERPFAKMVSEHIGSVHTELLIEPDELMQDLEQVAAHFDDVFADWGMVSTRLLYKKCREHGIKVVLVGEGSDELFGGYDIFKHSLQRENQPMEWRLFQLYRSYAGRRYGSQYLQFRSLMKTYLRENDDDLFAAIRMFESRHQLPNNFVQKVDKASMSQSIEARTPFLDARIANLAYQIPGDRLISSNDEKLLLKSMAKRYQLLPDAILERPKFGAGVAANWMDEPGELRDFAREMVLQKNTWVDQLGLRDAMQRYFDKGEFGFGFPHSISIFRNLAWRLLVLNLWGKALNVEP